MNAKTESRSVGKKGKKLTSPSTPSVLKTPPLPDNSALPLADFYEEEQPVVRSLFKAFVENVQDVTFGNATIARFIQEGLLCVSDGVLRVSPTIQNDEAFSWWITTLISFTAKTMLSVEGLGVKDRTAIYDNLCKLSPFFSRKSSDSSNCSKKLPSFCKKCQSNRSNESSKSPTSRSPNSFLNQLGRRKCPGAMCPKRKKMQCDFESQAIILQSYWRLIRQSIKKLMRGEPITGVARNKKTMDPETRRMALSMGINALCKLDPHQLFKRLESVCTEHVMTLKVSLWNILVTPNKVPCLKKYYDLKPPASAIAIAQAKLFIKALLDDFSKFQDVVKVVCDYLVPLDTEYLKQFGVTWSNVNYHIFDKVIYQDDLFRSFVPHMEAALQVKLTGDGPVEINIDKIPPAPWPLNDDFQKHLPELLSGVMELVKSFKLFHRLMLTSREMFRRADLLMQAYLKQQLFLRNRTKEELIEKDVDFFTQQRRIMRKLARRNKTVNKKVLLESLSGATSHSPLNQTFPADDEYSENDMQSDIDEADEAEFVRRFKDLLNRGPDVIGKCNLECKMHETICKYCNHVHCACDECEFYHMVLCGLVDCGIDCGLEVEDMDSDIQELHSIITLNADEEQLLCSGGPLVMNVNDSLMPATKSKTIINKKKFSMKAIRSPPETTFSTMSEETKKLANFPAFKEVRRIVEESAEDEKESAEMIFGVSAGVLESSSLFTLHKTTELCNKLSDAQSNWDAGLDYPFTCKCEEEDLEDDYDNDTSHLPPCKTSQARQRLNRTIPRKSVLMKRTKSTAAAATAISATLTSSTVDGQCYISENKKSVVHVDKKGICVTQITKTKTTPRGRFMPKRAKQTSSNSAGGPTDNHVCNEDSEGISGDESSEMKAADIQRISEKIVQEIERSFTSESIVLNESTNNDINSAFDKSADGKNKTCFSNFFNPDCRKLIESLMRRQNSDANTNSTQSIVCEEEETGDSNSVDLSEDEECRHDHDHDSCSTQSGENRDRYSRCDCCYCTYLAGDRPSRHDGRRNEEIRERLRKVLKKREKQWDAVRGQSQSSDVRDHVTEAETKVEIKHEHVEERSLEELLQFINEKTPADTQLSSTKAEKRARQKQRKLEEKRKIEEEERAKREALEKEVAEKKAKVAIENAKKNQEKRPKSKKCRDQPADAEIKKTVEKELSESATIEDSLKNKDQVISAKAVNKARQQQKKIEDKKKLEDERQRKLEEDRLRQELIKKEKMEKEARLKDEKRKRVEGQKQAKLEKTEKKKALKVENKKVEESKNMQSANFKSKNEERIVRKEIMEELPTTDPFVKIHVLDVNSDNQLQDSNRHAKIENAAFINGCDVSPVPPTYMDVSSSYFLSHGTESTSYQFSIDGRKEKSEEMQYVSQHASLIAATAEPNEIPLNPPSSLSVGQQQQYFGWVKQLQTTPFQASFLNTNEQQNSLSSALPVPNNATNFSDLMPNPGFVLPVHSTSLPSSRYGAIGEKLPQRKTFNQYAAYDRETNHILGISQPYFAQFGVLSSTSAVSSPTPSYAHRPSSVTSSMKLTNKTSGHQVLKQEAASRFCSIENTLSTTAISNNQPFQTSDCVNFEVPDKNGIAETQHQNGVHFSSSPSLFAEKIGCAAAGSSSIWSHDDDAKRFVEQEEKGCAIFKFSEC